jgi:serine phosphatase RsbU (regulator of sigma subunit)/anti-sigma regulatory factor (Ser/Thr protein kinase)
MADQGRDDADLLHSLSEVINADLDLQRILQVATDAATALSGAAFGGFFYNGRDDDGHVHTSYVVSGVDPAAFAGMSLPRITSLFEPTFSGRGTVRIDDLPRDPRLSGLPPRHLSVRSYLSTSVVARTGEVIGALLFGHPEPGVFDERSERAVRSVAAQAAVAIENARLLAAEQVARRQAEQTTARLALLQEVTARLARTLTTVEAVDAVMETIVSRLGADRAGVFLLTADGGLQAVAGHQGLTGSSAPQYSNLARGSRDPVSVTYATGEPLLARSAGEVRALLTPEQAATIRSLGSLACLPLVAAGARQGVLGLGWEAPQELVAAEVEMLSAAAGQLAQALERARLYEAERAARFDLSRSVAELSDVSAALQRSLLPRELPVVEQLQVAVRYLPGVAHAQVGGDWYDVVATPGGGATLVVGDVQGHSLAAAAVMGQLRTALHAYLTEGHHPDVALARANLLMSELDPSVLATCSIFALDTQTGSARIVRAGHPLPVLLRADGSAGEVAVDGGVPLGVLDQATWPVTTVTLDAGDRLVLYTDGLIERRDSDLDHGVAALLSAVGAVAPGHSAEQACDDLLAALSQGLTDDVALLVCDYAGPAEGRAAAAITLPADLRAIGDARAFAAVTLARWGLGLLTDTVTLLASEMVTNAMVHTEGPATLELRRDGDTVRLRVSDADTRPPQLREGPEPDLESDGGRGMVLVEALSSSWGVEPSGSGKTVWADVDALT